MSTSDFVIACLLILCITLTVLYSKSCKKSKTDSANTTALTDTLTIVKNRDSSETARIASFEVQKLTDLLKIKSQDSAIQSLQAAIKANKGASSVVVVTNETKVNTGTGTTITKTDTIDNYIYPTYESRVSLGKWVNIHTIARADSTYHDLSIVNEYDVVLKREKGQLNAYVTNKNPYTNTKTMRAASLAEPRVKRFGIGPSAGVTWYNGKPQPYIGVGVHFNLIKF